MKYLLIFSSIALNSAAQLLIRKGMLEYNKSSVYGLVATIIGLLTNYYLIAAMASYAISIVLWMFVMSKVEASFAVPFQSIGFVLVALLGWLLLGEEVSFTRIIGIFIIIIGVVFVSKS